MRPDEYEALRSLAGLDETPESKPYRPQSEYVLPAICVGFALWLIPILAINAVLPPRDLVLPFGCGSLVVLLAGSFWFFRRRARRKDLAEEPKRQARERERRVRYAADLQVREVDEWRLRVVNAVEAEGMEDVGSDFYLELEDGRVLLVSENDLADELYDQDYNLRFPTREVMLTWLPHAGEMIAIEGLGEKMPVSESWPDFTPEVYKNDLFPPRGTFLPGPISRYRHLHLDDDETDEDSE
jgi:hypothetical protein